MASNELSPNIRFEGFSDPWEQRKVCEIANKTFGGGTPKTNVSEYWNGNIPWIQSSNLSEHQLFDVDIQKHITTDGLQKSATQLVPKNSIAVVSHVGVGKLVFMPFEYATSQDFISLSDLNTDPTFSCYALYKIIQDDLHIVQGSAIKGITKEVLLNKEITFPEYAEQKKIGEVLRSMDHLITLHQRKLEKLKNIKKSMLEKMFPRDGSEIPEVRFAGFTDPWEQRKLGDVFQEYSEKNHEELPALTIIQGKGTILREESDRNLQYDKSSLSGYKMVRQDDFIVHLRSFEGGLEKANTDGIISPAYHTFHGDNTDTRFYYPFFRSRQFIDVLLKPHVYGIRDGKSIDISGIKTIDIPVPSYEEQKVIGDFLESLDNTITLHQCKLEKMKNIKKSMLEGMFV